MGMRINTNVEAFNAQRNLSATGNVYAKSVEKLSSGLRINRAGDDAAGLSISEKMRAQIKGLAAAQRNAQDGISMIQTGEGALNEVHSMLQRMRELAVQASNDTLSDEDRTSINTELQQLSSEIDATRDRTKFNGKNLLTGSLKTTLGGATGTDLVVGDQLATTAVAAVTAVDVSGARAGTTYTLTASGATGLTLTRGGDSVAQTITVGALGANASGTLDFSSLGIKISLQANASGKAAADIVTDLTAAANDTIVTAAGSGSANLQIGAGSADAMSIAFSEISVDTLNGGAAGLDTILTTLNTGTAQRTVANFQSLMNTLETSINYVSSQRGTLGAAQNRLEHTIANLGVAQENLSASESRIRDVDMAAEMVNFTKTGILQQAGQAILAQANQAPQGVLSLLR
jgi:flagellin